MTISKTLRFQVLRRDNHACRYCGRTASDVELEVDHVIPEALGGRTEPSNLVTACSDCNSGKAATPPDAALVEDVAQDALRWSRAIQAAAHRMCENMQDRRAIYDGFDQAWGRWVTPAGQQAPRPADWRGSVDAFIATGLPWPVLIDCVTLAMTREKVTADNKWRYMCGVAWSRVSELQDAARALLAEGEDFTPAVPVAPPRWALCESTTGPFATAQVIPQAITTAEVASRWEEMVGPDLNRHARPVRLEGGELLLHTDTTAWATQVRLLTSALVKRLTETFGEGVVQRITVRRGSRP